MPPRCPAPSPVRRAAEVTFCRPEEDNIDNNNRDATFEKREQQQQQQQHPQQQPGCVSCPSSRAAAPPPLPTATPFDAARIRRGMSAHEAADPGGGEGESPRGAGGYGFPLLYPRPGASEAETTLEDEETSSETSSSSGSSAVSSGAMMELSAREEGGGDEDDLGILTPALLHRGGGADSVCREGGRSSYYPYRHHDRDHHHHPPSLSSCSDPQMRQAFFRVRTCITDSVPKTLSAATSTGSGRSSRGTPSRRIGYHFRALSSQCLEGLDCGDSDGGGGAGGGHHHRRERSESEPRLLLGTSLHLHFAIFAR